MNFLLGLHKSDNKKKLVPRNEGKIKSYQSCTDVRAWSHSLQVRDRHLREWVKRDMPICVLPVCTLASLLRTMTRGTRRKAAPRCHPNCKSKAVLDSLCTSCHAIKECLRGDPSLHKYFVEEEIYTSHWPCERYLDILKSVKMFWKIIIEKIFSINITTCEEFDRVQDKETATVQSVAKLLEKEILEQSLIVKNVMPLLSKELIKCNNIFKKSCNQIYSNIHVPSKCKTETEYEVNGAENQSFYISKNTKNAHKSSCSVSTQYTSSVSPRAKYNRSTSFNPKTMDFCCNTIDINNNNDEILMYKRNIEYLQEKCLKQENEIQELRIRNNSLKIELQNIHKTQSYLFAIQNKENTLSNCDIATQVPKPFELLEDDLKMKQILTNTDSEMIITLKNCKHESFKQVSLLQVLHKTNLPIVDESVSLPCRRQENPVDVLNKVQNKFEQIVKREIKIAKSKNENDKQNIDARFCRIDRSSAPSCSTFFTETNSSCYECSKSNL